MSPCRPLALALMLLVPVAGHSVPVTPEPQAESLIRDLGLHPTAQPIRQSGHWAPPEQVLVYLPANRPPPRPDFEAWMRAAAPGARLVFARNLDELQDLKADADVLLGRCMDAGEEMFNLRWVQNYFVGIDRCTDNPVFTEGNVLLTNTRAVPGPGMAEHAIGLMLMLTHGLHIYHGQQLESRWQRLERAHERVMEVGGRTLLVVGLGGIGRQIAKRAHGLGMRVTATRNSSRQGPDYVDYVGLADELPKLTAEADVVINVTPLTDTTRGLFDRAFFRAMKPGAYFINMGRGKSVVTDDLLAALKAGEIAGAGLDVTEPEPLPADHPLWRQPNVIITPHSSSPSTKMVERFWILVRENLRRYAAGEPMLNVTDVRRGY